MQRLTASCLRSLLRCAGQAAARPATQLRPPPTALFTPPPVHPLPFQHQQLALFRSRLPKSTHAPLQLHLGKHGAGARKPRSRLRRGLAAVGKGLGIALVSMPLAGTVALVLSGIQDAHAADIILSVPRTAGALWWGIGAAYRYKALGARHPDRNSELYTQELAVLHESEAQKLLLMCQSNGGVYIKAGQLAVSLRAVPLEYRRTLEVLQDKVPPRPFEDIRKALTHELGAPVQELFSQFDHTATAAASLAQVHRAWLKDGTPVAVKVQYPGLESEVMGDVASMVALARAGARLFPDVNLVWLFEELRGKLGQELDFGIEARNSARLAECFRGQRGVAAPQVVPQLSGRKVLCMEWVEGCKVSDEEGLVQAGLVPKEVGMALLEAFADMTFLHGFVHGDPHPGNILVRADWDSQSWLSRLALGRRPRPQLVLLDHGLYVEVPQEMRRQYCQLWCAFVLNDKDTAVQAATALGGEQAGRILPEVLRPRNWSQVSREERKKFRDDSGIHTFADLGQILEQAPRPLLDTLRLSAIVRHAASQLGATIADRLRINATAAFHGMELHPPPAPPPAEAVSKAGGQMAQAQGRGWRRRRQEEAAAADALQRQQEAAVSAGAGERFYGVLQSRTKRWQLVARIWVMRGVFWVASTLQGLVERVMPGTTLLA